MFDSIFNPDNAVFTFINKIVDLIILSLIFIVCCLPVVTIGPACSALYYAVVKSIRKQRSYCAKEFSREFRASLKKGSIIHLILIVLTVISLITDVPLMFSFFETGEMNNIFLGLLFVFKIIVLLGLVCWIYPLTSRYEQDLLKYFHWALYLLLKHIPRTLLCIVIAFSSILLFLLEPLFLVILPSITALLISFLTEPILRTICSEEDASNNEKDNWYLEN